MRREGDIIVFELAHRDRDHVKIGEDGMDTLHLLLGIGRREHTRWLKHHLKNNQEYADSLKFQDKVIERLFFAAKEVTIKVDWDKWADIEREINRENRRLNK